MAARKTRRRVDEMRASLETCKGKTAAEAYEVAETTDYAPAFYYSFDVDVTGAVGEGSKDDAVCKAEQERREAERATEEAEAKKDKMNLATGEASNYKSCLSVTVTGVRRELLNHDGSPIAAVGGHHLELGIKA